MSSTKAAPECSFHSRHRRMQELPVPSQRQLYQYYWISPVCLSPRLQRKWQINMHRSGSSFVNDGAACDERKTQLMHTLWQKNDVDMFYKDCQGVPRLMWRRSLEERTVKEKKNDGQDKPNENLSDEKWRSRARVKGLLDEQEITEDGKELNKTIVDGRKDFKWRECAERISSYMQLLWPGRHVPHENLCKTCFVRFVQCFFL